MTKLLKTPYEVGFHDASRAGRMHQVLEDLLKSPMVVAAFPGLGREEILARSEEVFWKRLKALPDLRRYPELEGMPQEAEERMHGLADGSGLTWKETLFWQQLHYILQHRHLGALHAPSGCSSAIFTDGPDGPLLSHNADWSAKWFVPPKPGEEAVIIVPKTGHRYGEGMNEKGLCFGAVSPGPRFDDELSPEIFPAPVVNLLHRYCATTEDALELLARYNFFWGPCIATLVDASGNAVAIDKTATRYGVRRPVYGRLWATEVAFVEPTISEFVWQRRGAFLAREDPFGGGKEAQFYADAMVRFTNFGRLMSQVEVRDFGAMARVMSDHSPFPRAICRHGGPDTASYDESTTVQQMITKVATKTVYRRYLRGQQHPCEQEWEAIALDFYPESTA